MTFISKQREMYEQASPTQTTQQSITIGTIVDTNDPHQMGRVRVLCPQWGDPWNAKVEDLPWAVYMTPFGGQTQTGPKGPGIQQSEGGIAYGAWFIPSMGAQAVVMCVDGNPANRLYMGCIYDQFTPHTMPHGRFMFEDHPELEKTGSDAKPFGPYTSTEKFIHPTSENIKQAFGNKAEPNFEYRSRGADMTVARVDVTQLDQTYSKVQDDKDVAVDDWISTQGYQQSRVDEDGTSTLTDKNYDSHVYAITTPGFHAMSMDDRQENCRIRFRTTAGAQILVDDTNERIYISTAKGNNWIEMDQDGNIDVFSTNKLNIHSVKDINMTSDETIRMHAKKGIHMYSEDELRIETLKDIHVKTEQNIRVHAVQSTYLLSDQAIHAKAGTSFFVESTAAFHVKAGSTLNLQSTGNMHFRSGGDMMLFSTSTMGLRTNSQLLQSGTQIHLNGPPPDTASPATATTAPSELKAFWTNRVPAHEPWNRVMTKDDFTHEPEFEYESKEVNRSERGRTIERGQYWRR